MVSWIAIHQVIEDIVLSRMNHPWLGKSIQECAHCLIVMIPYESF
jgi:hypothetical protein